MTRTVSSQYSEPGDSSPSAGESATIACVICKAVYTPAPLYGYLLQAPLIALESALMSMCHFCFRCRRPACPGCWDGVNGVCGECALEVHLPFRSQATPLRGALFAPSRQAQLARDPAQRPPLVCIYPGRFERGSSSSIDTIPTRPDRTRSSGGSEKQTAQLERRRYDTRRPRHVDVDEIETQPGRRVPVTKRLGRSLAVVLFAALIAAVALVVFAMLSLDANRGIYTIIHIDIRAEMAYIWQLLKNLLAMG